jgi:hypothetical protein
MRFCFVMAVLPFASRQFYLLFVFLQLDQHQHSLSCQSDGVSPFPSADAKARCVTPATEEKYRFRRRDQGE